MARRLVLLFFWVLLMAFSGSAVSKKASGYSEQRKEFGDWGLACFSEKGDVGAVLCYIQQTQFMRSNQGKDRFVLRLSIIVSSKRKRLEIDLPLGVDLKYGVYLQMGRGALLRHDYSACIGGVCSALIEMSQEDLIGISQEKDMHIKFRYFGDSEYVGFTMPLTGFGPALGESENLMSGVVFK